MLQIWQFPGLSKTTSWNEAKKIQFLKVKKHKQKLRWSVQGDNTEKCITPSCQYIQFNL